MMTSLTTQVSHMLHCHDIMPQMVGLVEVDSMLHAELQILVVAFLRSMVAHLSILVPANGLQRTDSMRELLQ